MSGEWLPAELLEKHGRFATSAAPWVAAGFNAIPAREVGNKVPAVPFKGLYEAQSPRIGGGDLKAWGEYMRDNPALLLLSSGARLGLVGVDIDALKRADWVNERFGESPLTVETGREGGGRHVYYRVAPGTRVSGSTNLIGPEDADPRKTRIDVKAWAGYVVAPGSLHKSGVVYRASVPFDELTPSFLGTLPEFDIERYEYERERGFLRRGTRPRSVSVRGAQPGSWAQTFADAGSLDDDEMVVTERGELVRLGDLPDQARIFAPHRDDQNPSATVFRRGTAFYVHDWSTQERWDVRVPCNLDIDALMRNAQAQSTQPEPPLKKRITGGGGVRQAQASPTPARVGADREPFPAYVDCRSAYTAEALRDQIAEHIGPRAEHVELDPGMANIRDAVLAHEAADPADVVFIVSPPGTGKTEVMEAVWRSPQARTAFAIVPSVALAHSGAARLQGGAVSYQDDGAEHAPKLVTTCHSLLRFEDPEHADLTLVDELSASMDAICAVKSLVQQPVDTLMRLLRLLNVSDRAIVGDADLDVRLLAFVIKRLAPHKRVRIYTHAYRNEQPVQVCSLDMAKAAMLEAVEHVDECRRAGIKRTIAVQCDTRAGCKQMLEVLQERFPDLRMVAVHGDNSDEIETHRMLADTSRMQQEYHVIIHNTAVATGVSFTGEVDGTYTLWENRDIAPKSVMQMHMRFRRSRARVIGMAEFKPERRPDTAKQVLQIYKNKNEVETQLLKKRLKDGFTMDLDGSYRINNEHFETAFFMLRAAEAEAQNDRGAEMRRLLRLRFALCETVVDLPDPTQADAVKNFREDQREVQRSLEAQRCEDVASAEPISDEDAKAIDRKHVRTKGEKNSLERHKIETFYEREISPALVEIDKRGKTRGALRRLARLRLILEGHEDKLGFIEFEKNRGQTLARQKTDYLEARCTAVLVRYVFDVPRDEDWIDYIARTEYDADEIRARAWAYIEKNRESLSALDMFGTLPKSQDRALAWLAVVVRRLGISSQRRKPAGRWLYRYDIKPPCALGQPCYLRMHAEYERRFAAHKWSREMDEFTDKVCKTRKTDAA